MNITQEQLGAEDFRKVDENIYIKQEPESRTRFVIYAGHKLDEIDLDDWDDEDLAFEVSGYYKSLKQLRQRHKTESNMEIVGCIAKNKYL